MWGEGAGRSGKVSGLSVQASRTLLGEGLRGRKVRRFYLARVPAWAGVGWVELWHSRTRWVGFQIMGCCQKRDGLPQSGEGY